MLLLKRFIAIFSIFVYMILPSFAWSQNSFLGNDYSSDVYSVSYDSSPAPAMYSLRSTSLAAEDSGSDSVLSITGRQFVDRLSNYHTGQALYCRYWFDNDIYGTMTHNYIVPATYASFVSGVDSLSSDLGAYKFWYTPLTVPATVEQDVPGRPEESGPLILYGDQILYSVFGTGGQSVDQSNNLVGSRLYFDLSDLGEFNSFELSGMTRFMAYITYPSAGENRYYSNLSLSLYVNDRLVQTFDADSDGLIDFSHFTYNSTVPIESMYFNFASPVWGIELDSESFSGRFGYRFYYTGMAVQPTFSYWNKDSSLGGYTDDLQNDVGAHESLESQWGGSMTTNFEKLNINGFTAPGGLVSGLALLSGIFQDVWYAFGDFNIVFVLPLTLAIVLLVSGRISRYLDRSGSRDNDRGGDSSA